jgi:hypothetical protein
MGELVLSAAATRRTQRVLRAGVLSEEMPRITLLAFFAGLSLLISGCGGSVKLASISGSVNLDGKPVKGGFISFTLPDGLPHTVEIQADGTYRVDDVPLGDAIVTVSAPPVNDQARQMHIKLPNEAPPPAPVVSPIPEKYAGMATTDLSYNVKAGENKFDANLKR